MFYSNTLKVYIEMIGLYYSLQIVLGFKTGTKFNFCEFVSFVQKLCNTDLYPNECIFLKIDKYFHQFLF